MNPWDLKEGEMQHTKPVPYTLHKYSNDEVGGLLFFLSLSL